MQNLHGCPLSARVEGESDGVNISEHNTNQSVAYLQHTLTSTHKHEVYFHLVEWKHLYSHVHVTGHDVQ